MFCGLLGLVDMTGAYLVFQSVAIMQLQSQPIVSVDVKTDLI